MFQDRFIKMLKAAIQNVFNKEIDDSTKELYDQLKEETKELREMDIEGPWRRNIQPGQRSDEVIDKFVCLNLVDNDPHQVLNLGMGEGKIVTCATCYLKYAILIMLLPLCIIAGAIIRDGDRKRAPFLVLGLAP